MAYKQQKKYGYRDSLEKGDPEKVIYGVDFDAEFEAIEAAFDTLTGGDSTIDPDDPAFVDVVFQNRPEAQKVISELSFEKAGDSPLTMKNTGMYAGTAYIRYTGVTWEVDPSMSVIGDITAGGNLTVDGTTQLNGDLSVNGNIGATGNISMDGNLAIGGVIDGDLTVNGNITVDGGSIIAPDGDGHIEDGTAENQVAHWHTADSKWVPVTNAFINDAGQMSLGVALPRSILHLKDASPDITLENANGDMATIGIGDASDTVLVSKSVDVTGNVTATGDGTISGTLHVGDLEGHHNFSVGQGNKAFSVNPVAPASSTESGHGYADVVRVNAYDWTADKPLPLSFRCERLYVDASGGGQMLNIDGATKAATFAGNVTAPDFIATSDIAMKTNVQTAPVGLIDQIRGVEFDWRDSGNSASGVIANEIERVLPHLVSEHQGVKHVSYMGLIAYLIEEIKALKNGD